MRVELMMDVVDEARTVYLLVRLYADVASASERPPVNLALVIDRSSSMRGPRITQAVAAASQVVAQLGARDRLSIITFDATARTVFGPAAVTDEARPALLDALEEIRTGVGTNLAAGIKKGSEAIRSGYVRGAVSRLVLLTDGQPSVGLTSPERLAAIAEKESSRGVSITTMGLGEGFDDELLTELATRGRGGFYYLATAADIPAAFGRELSGVFSIAAAGTEVKLLPTDETLAVEVLHRLPSRFTEDGLIVELGEVAAGTPRQVLFKLIRKPGETNPRCGTLIVSFRRSDGSAGDGHILGIELPSSLNDKTRDKDKDRDNDKAARDVALERIRLAVASAVDVAWARRASGDSMQALAALTDIKQEVEQMRTSGRAAPEPLAELLEDIAEAEGAVAKSSAERERARRSMRERSHITLLGHSTIRQLPPEDD